MLLTGIFIIVIIAVCAYWYFNLRAREIALGAATYLCKTEQVQLLDDSVALRKALLKRYEGALCFNRLYTFDYVDNGTRLTASLTIVHNEMVNHQMPIDQSSPYAKHKVVQFKDFKHWKSRNDDHL